VLTETPGATDTTSLYDFGTSDDGYLVKFILPTVVALLGLVEFFMAAGLLVYVYSTTDKVTCFALFVGRPRPEGWPHHGRTFSIYPCPLSF